MESGEEVPRSTLTREAIIASVGILVALTAIKSIPKGNIVGEHAFTIAAGLQLYVPIWLVGKRGITLKRLGLTLDAWRTDFLIVLVLSVVTIVPFAIGHHFWQTLVFHRTFNFRLPNDLLMNAVLQNIVVALAEETYFRGYLQERLQRLWPAKRKIFGTPFGAAIIVSAAVFALAHFVGEYRVERLGPFFPALVFGLLRARTGTIAGATAYHAFCNLLGELAWASYHS